MEEVYNMTQIKELWQEYKEAKAWRVLRDGKWKLYKKAPDTTSGATRCEMINVKEHIEFPKYIEAFK